MLTRGFGDADILAQCPISNAVPLKASTTHGGVEGFAEAQEICNQDARHIVKELVQSMSLGVVVLRARLSEVRLTLE